MGWLQALGPTLGVVGDLISSNQEKKNQQANIDAQKEFAQHGIRWRVQDAIDAGIHPLAALGSPGASFSPVSVGDTSPGRALSNFGQDVSRAVQATRTRDERALADLRLASARADLDGKVIDNQIRASELRRMNQPGQVPFPDGSMTGDASSPQHSTPWQEPGFLRDVEFIRTNTGGFAPAMPPKLAESMESDPLGSVWWRARAHALPTLGLAPPPDKSYLPKGFDRWSWHPFLQEWRPKRGEGFVGKAFKRIRRSLDSQARWKRERSKSLGSYIGR